MRLHILDLVIHQLTITKYIVNITDKYTNQTKDYIYWLDRVDGLQKYDIIDRNKTSLSNHQTYVSHVEN